jgi:hypothetical protein
MRVGALGVSVKSFDRPARQLRFEPPSHRLEPPTSATAGGGGFAPAPTDHSLDGPAYKPATGATFSRVHPYNNLESPDSPATLPRSDTYAIASRNKTS